MKEFIYISYAEKDKNAAIEVLEYLENRGVSCFIAPRDVNPSERYAKQIVDAINGCGAALLICSSAVADSDRTFNEIDIMVSSGKPIVPFFIEEFELNDELRYYIGRKQRIIASSGSISDSFDKLASLLSAYVRFPTAEEISKSKYKIDVYEGDEPYVFISYAHKDSARVLPLVAALAERGIRIWYDSSVEYGYDWPDYIADHLERAGCVIAFLSEASLASKNCRQEINVAIDDDIPMLTVYVDDIKLTGGMRMRLGLTQALYMNRYSSTDDVAAELSGAKLIAPCFDGNRAVSRTNLKAHSKPIVPISLDNGEFLIEDGVLREYRGSGGEVKIPVGVVKVLERSFENCTSLTAIEIPEGVTVIERDAFIGCSGIKKISIPDSLERGVAEAFENSDADDSDFQHTEYKGGIYLGNERNPYVSFLCFDEETDEPFEFHPNTRIIESGAFEYSDISFTDVRIPSSVKSIGESAFSGCSTLERIELPEGLLYIGYRAFEGCNSLTSITMPKSLKEIGENALWECNKLESITLPFLGGTPSEEDEGNRNLEYVLYPIPETLKSVTLTATDTVYANAFSGYRSLTDITILAGVKEIGEFAFDGCSALERIKLPEGLLSIGDRAFLNCDSLTAITIPAGVKEIGESAFYGCSTLERIELSEGLLSIGESAFDGCSALERIELPEGLLSICKYAFSDCNSLTAITIPKSLKEIGESAFDGCSALERIELPEGLLSIGESAFDGCSALERIELPEGLLSIGKYAFSGCNSLTSITMPKSLKEIGENALWECNKLESITLPFLGGTPSEEDEGNRNLEYVLYPIPETLKSVTLTATDTVYADAFSGCESVERLVLCEGVRRIEENGLAGLKNLCTLSVPDSLEYFDAYALDDDIDVEKLNWSISRVGMYIGNEKNNYAVFLGMFDSSKESLELHPDTKLIIDTAFADNTVITEITLPDGLSVIGAEAFSGCTGIKKISVPESVRRIGDRAFAGCTSLEEITVPLSAEFGEDVFPEGVRITYL